MSKKIWVLLIIIVVAGGGIAFTNQETRAMIRQKIADLTGSVAGGEHEGGEHEGEGEEGEESEGEGRKIIVTSPIAKDVTLTQQFVCQIHARRHIDVKALEGGYLQKIHVKEGQAVKEGDVMFQILSTLYRARLQADMAEADVADVEYKNTKRLVEQDIVSPQQLKIAKAKLERALAKVQLAKAEMNFASIKAPFDGIIDTLHEQEGSLIEEGAMLTTMSDNHLMWVYFNVPEARYLEYQHAVEEGRKEEFNIELKLANQEIFDQPGKLGAIEADFNNRTGNIKFRGDFPNPKRLLRHGQTGNILVHRLEKDAVVIPQRATYEILAKTYSYVVDEDNVVHQREIKIKDELEDIFVIEEGLKPGEKIILEGIRQVRDGKKIKYDFVEPTEVLANLKNHAE